MIGQTNAQVVGYPDNYYKVNPYTTQLSNEFWANTTTTWFPEEFTLDMTGCQYITNIDNCFYNFKDAQGASLKTLNIIGCPSTIIVWTLFLCRQYLLETINGELDFTSYISTGNPRPFFNCSALEEVRFKAGSIAENLTLAQCANLSDDSLASILAGLKDWSTLQQTRTLTLHSTALSKLTTAQITAANAKGWTVTS